MKLHDYQKAARNFLLNRLEVVDGAGLWLDPGLGKTAVTLHTILALKLLHGLGQTTIIAPSRVLETAWPVEIANWNLPLSWAWIKGDEAEREAALATKADCIFLSAESLAKAEVDNKFVGDGYTVEFKKGRFLLKLESLNLTYEFDTLKKLVAAHPEAEPVLQKRFRQREQLPNWLDRMKYRADLLVIDEVTKFRNWGAARTKYVTKLVARHKKRITLTGTPVPANLGEDLFPQQFILDQGKTLGTGITKFREQWMRPVGDYHDYEMVPQLVPEFIKRISPWYLRQEITDYLDMPELVNKEIVVNLPEPAMDKYKKFAKEMYLELEQNELVALNGGSKYNLCRQIASGSAYDPDKKIVHIHDAKLDALEDLLDELNGKPLLVAYCFNHELLKLQKRWPKIAHFNDGRSATELIAKWREGKIRMLAAQSQAISHGVNGLQSANDICLFSPTDQPETREQLIARIYRQGVRGQVRVYHLLAKGTVDIKIKRVLDQKGATQSQVLRAIKDGQEVAKVA